MKLRTSELTGAALAFAVATALKDDVACLIADGEPQVWWTGDVGFVERPTIGGDGKCRFLLPDGTAVSLFGNPYEAEDYDLATLMRDTGISVLRNGDGKWEAGTAWEFFQSESFAYHRSGGATPHEAALRCFVQMKLGEVVEVPDGWL